MIVHYLIREVDAAAVSSYPVGVRLTGDGFDDEMEAVRFADRFNYCLHPDCGIRYHVIAWEETMAMPPEWYGHLKLSPAEQRDVELAWQRLPEAQRQKAFAWRKLRGGQ